MHPRTLLLVFVGVIPLVVAGAGFASFLLLRAGYGIAVWAGVPFVVLLLIVGVIGAVLGRSGGAGRRRRDRDGV